MNNWSRYFAWIALVSGKVTPPNGQTYTSQLFFPGVSQNQADSIYSSSMLVTLDSTKTPAAATFTFVVNLP